MDRAYTPQSAGYRRKCWKCRVDRHDRCIGGQDCGCEDRAHQATTDAMAALGLGPDGTAAGAFGASGYMDLDELAGLPNGAIVGVTIDIELGIYRRLMETAKLQDRTIGIVIRRALEHAWGCGMGECVHGVDPIAEAV